MSLKVSAEKARVSWLSKESNKNPELLTATQGILYVPKTPVKLGQVTKDTVANMNPKAAFESRYKDKSTISEDIVAEDIYVFDKTNGANFDYDDGVRRLAHKLYLAKQIPFDALTPEYQKPGYNSEALIDYMPRNHRRILDKVIKQYFGIKKYWDPRRQIKWRWGQDDEVNEIRNTLISEKTCLYAAYTGRGKTTISVGVVSKLLPKGGLVLVTTPIKDTRDGFEDKIEGWNFGGNRERKVTFLDNYAFAKTTVKELRERADKGELIFVVLTVQDVRYQDNATDDEALRDKYQALAGHLDVWIRDEKHLQYRAELTAMRLANLSATYTLDLTATPYGVMDEYEDKQVVARTLVWGLLNRKHTLLPQIFIDAIATPFQNINPALASIYNEQEGFDPRKLFAMKNGNFVFRSEFAALDKLFYQSTISKNKNQLSIVNDTELSPISTRCGMWVCPDGTAENPASVYVPALANMLNVGSNGDTYYVSSYEVEQLARTSNISIGAYVDRLLEDNKRVVILTCGKFTTGTDIEALGHIVLMDNVQNIANFEQLIGRMARVLTGKESVKLYSLVPGQTIKIILGRLRRETAKLTGTSEVEMFDCIPFTEYDSGSPRRVDVSEMLKAAQEWSLDLMRGNFRSTDFDLLTRGDLDDLMSVLPNPKGRKAGSGKMLINEKNDSKVKTRKGGKARSPKDSDDLSNKDRKAYLNTLQTVVREMRWVSKTQDCYTLDKIFDNKILKDRFGVELMNCLTRISDRNPKFAKSLSERLSEYREAFAGLQPEQYHDLVFQNSKENQKTLNLVYSSMEAAELVVKHVEKAGKRNPKSIAIMNAQSGSVVMAIKAKYPNATITCLEEFTHFRHFLENLGAQIETLDINSRKTYDLIVAMPPIDIRTYRKYFKFAVEHAKLVACLMPYITDDRENELHRNRVKEHKILISKSLADLYPSMANYTEVKCVVASGLT